LLLGFAQRGERVGGLAGLADRDDNRVVLDQRIAITEFAGIRRFGDDFRQIFKEIIAHETRVPRGALSGQDKTARLDQLAGQRLNAAENNSALALLGAPAQAVSNRIGLLKDLLEHVMLVVAKLVLFELVLELAED